MNVLYLSCHDVLEYDELRILSSIPGLEIMPLGGYYRPREGCPMRPPLDFDYPEEWRERYGRVIATDDEPDQRNHLTPDFLQPFDTIIIMSVWDWVYRNLAAMRGKIVVWRDIGQTSPEDESRHIARAIESGVKIVRYWDGYQDRNDYRGHDAVIPFGKFPEDYPRWTGDENKVLGLAQRFYARPEECGLDEWDYVKGDCQGTLLGAHNDSSPGHVHAYSKILKHLQSHRAMWYAGTRPAPYTLTLMEAMFTGIPIYTMRSRGWESALPSLLPDSQLFDLREDLRQGLKKATQTDPADLAEVSLSQSAVAKKMFDARKARDNWETFFKTL